MYLIIDCTKPVGWSEFSHIEFYIYYLQGSLTICFAMQLARMTFLSHPEKTLWLKYYVLFSNIFLVEKEFEVEALASQWLCG